MKADDLKGIPLFADFDKEALEHLAKMCTEKSVAMGEEVFHQDDVGDSLILIQMGQIKLIKNNDEGVEQEIVSMGSGSWLGEMAMLDPGKRSLTAIAREPTRYSEIPYSELVAFFDDNPAAAAQFYRKVAVTIARRLRYLNEDFTSLKSFLKRRD